MLGTIYDAFSSYNDKTMKANVIQASIRITIHMDKKKNLCIMKKREIAGLIGKQEVEAARIRCEQVIRDDFTMEAAAVLQLMLDLIKERLK